MTRTKIKSIAIITMLLNHIAHIFMRPGTPLAILFTAVGYFTAPVMCYMLVQGFEHTRSRKRYGARLLIFATLSQIPFGLVFDEFSPGILNIMFTLFFSFLMLCVKESVKDPFLRIGLLIFLMTITFYCDWYIVAPVLIIELYESRTKSSMAISYGVCTGLVMAFTYMSVRDDPAYSVTSVYALSLLAGVAVAAAGFMILYAYDGRKEERKSWFSKWFFYLFYPGHLLVLYLISIM